MGNSKVWTHGSLCSGMGGFDLASQWMGWNNVFHCEKDPLLRKVLTYYWPKSFSYANIRDTDFTVWRGIIDCLTAGFPCQPFSVSGNRKGTADDRYLWPQVYRAVREILPYTFVAENVRGLVNWNKGMVFEQIHADLEAAGYETSAYLLPACSVDAPHQRDRIWIIAHYTGRGLEAIGKPGKVLRKKRTPKGAGSKGIWDESANGAPAHSYPHVQGLQVTARAQQRSFPEEDGIKQRRSFDGIFAAPARWNRWPDQPAFCNGDDGLSGRLDGITFSDYRNASVKAAGNAIVPQVALQIFQALSTWEQCHLKIS